MQTVSCVLCSAQLPAPCLSPSLYIDHLRAVHAVTSSVDWLVTRSLQQSSLTRSSCRLQDSLPPSVSITPVYKRKSVDGVKVSSEDSLTRCGETGAGDGITLYKETLVTPLEAAPPWTLGCLYQCQICRVKFQTVTSFRSHLFFHNLSVEEYTDLHGELGVKLTQHRYVVPINQRVFSVMMGMVI